MADVRHELPPLAFNLGKLRRHGVERPGQTAHLVLRGGRDPLAVVAIGHGAGGRGHLPKRQDHAVSEQLDDHERDDQTACEGEPCMEAEGEGREDRPDRRYDRPADDEPEFHLDRPNPVERPRSEVRCRHQLPCPSVPAYPTPLHSSDDVCSNLATYRTHVRVNRPRTRAVPVSPDLGEQLISRADDTGRQEKVDEQVELRCRQSDQLPIEPGSAPRHVDFDAASAQHAIRIAC